MKKLMMFLVIILINSFFLISCGENKNPMIQEEPNSVSQDTLNAEKYVGLHGDITYSLEKNILRIYVFKSTQTTNKIGILLKSEMDVSSFYKIELAEPVHSTYTLYIRVDENSFTDINFYCVPL